LEHCIHHLVLLKISGISFVFAIILNFLSQFSGKKANEFDTQFNYRSIDKLVLNIKNQSEIDEVDNKAEHYSNWTNWYNNASLTALTVGLITLISFFIFIF